MSAASFRTSLVGVGLGGLVAAPIALAVLSGRGTVQLVDAGVAGLLAAFDSVGWVLAPQLVLAVAVFGLALQQIAFRLGGIPQEPLPRWLDPAVESALLLGMLGTISGMVSGFVGLSPGELEPGPLVHSLGAALRSSFVGFSIALVGIWTRTGAPAETDAGEALA